MSQEEDIEKIKAVAIASAQERIQSYDRYAELRDMLYEVEGIMRYSGAGVAVYEAMLNIQFRCPDCDDVHRHGLFFYLARSGDGDGDDFVTMKPEMILKPEEEEEESETAGVKVVMIPVSHNTMLSIEKAVKGAMESDEHDRHGS